MSYKIEKNVPVQRYSSYPFEDMKVGDSFHVPKGDPAVHRNILKNGYYDAPRVVLAARSYGWKRGLKFACRSDGEGGYRLWRVK